MSLNHILTSLHGHRFGLSASGGLLHKPTTSTGISHAAELSSAAVFQSSISSFRATITEMEVARLRSVLETISTSGAKLSNYGVSLLSSATDESRIFDMSAPVAGVEKEIISVSSATTVTISNTATTITFGTTVGLASATKITMELTGGVSGERIVLRGLSATRWMVLNKSGGVTV